MVTIPGRVASCDAHYYIFRFILLLFLPYIHITQNKNNDNNADYMLSFLRANRHYVTQEIYLFSKNTKNVYHVHKRQPLHSLLGELVHKYMKQFTQFIKATDFDKI